MFHTTFYGIVGKVLRVKGENLLELTETLIINLSDSGRIWQFSSTEHEDSRDLSCPSKMGFKRSSSGCFTSIFTDFMQQNTLTAYSCMLASRPLLQRQHLQQQNLFFSSGGRGRGELSVGQHHLCKTSLSQAEK